MTVKMGEIRLAGKDEVTRQKEIWKLCFKDSDSFIDFFFANKYKADETILLLHEGEIAARLTMLPVQTVTADQRSFRSTMLYAVATHPDYQNRGFATQMMNFTHQYLREKGKAFSVLVPAEKQLFDFYHKQGYEDGFYLREILLTRERMERFPLANDALGTIRGITPQEYNQQRNKLLRGRLHIAYHDEEISYQKKLSLKSGADIFCIEIAKAQGCAAIERLSPDRILVKEMLIPDHVISMAAKQIAELLPAKEYVMRTPAFLGEPLGGMVRPFGMIKRTREMEVKITPGDLGYLGFAFD